jgi:hypothetical protein
MQQISEAIVEVAVIAQCETGSPDAAAGATAPAGTEIEALRNELAARDATVANAAIRADTMMMRLHEAQAECAAAEAALARIQHSAAPHSPAEIAVMHPVPVRAAPIDGEAGLGGAVAALHTAQAETAERDAALVRATAEAAEQRAVATAARDEIRTLRKQLADCRQALAGVGQPAIEWKPARAAAEGPNDAEPPSESPVGERPRPLVDPERGEQAPTEPMGPTGDTGRVTPPST